MCADEKYCAATAPAPRIVEDALFSLSKAVAGIQDATEAVKQAHNRYLPGAPAEGIESCEDVSPPALHRDKIIQFTEILGQCRAEIVDAADSL